MSSKSHVAITLHSITHTHSLTHADDHTEASNTLSACQLFFWLLSKS